MYLPVLQERTTISY